MRNNPNGARVDRFPLCSVKQFIIDWIELIESPEPTNGCIAASILIQWDENNARAREKHLSPNQQILYKFRQSGIRVLAREKKRIEKNLVKKSVADRMQRVNANIVNEGSIRMYRWLFKFKHWFVLNTCEKKREEEA